MKIDAPALPVAHPETPLPPVNTTGATAAAAHNKSVQHALGTSAQEATRFASALAQNSVALDKRQLLAGMNAQNAKAMKLEEMFSLLTGSQAKNGMDEAVRKLRAQLREDPSFDQLMEHADNDPAQAHLLLQAAIRQAGGERNEQEKGALEGHIQVLEKRYGKQARAGINTARAFGRAGNDPKRRKDMRNLYYAGVIMEQTVLGMINVLLGQCENQEGRDRFGDALTDMKAAIADDLAALRPSTSTVHLRTLMKGMSTAQHLTDLLEHCDNLLGRMRAKNPGLNIESPKFLKHLILLTGEGMNLRKTHDLAKLIAGNGLMAGDALKLKLAFLNGLLALLVNKIPKELWRDRKSQDNAITNLKLLLADLTREEKQTSAEKSAFQVLPTFHEQAEQSDVVANLNSSAKDALMKPTGTPRLESAPFSQPSSQPSTATETDQPAGAATA